MQQPLLHISTVRHPSVGCPVALFAQGELDISSVAQLDAAIRSTLDPDDCAQVELDLSGVEFADSTAISLLLRHRQQYGDRFLLGQCSAPMLRVLQITGVDTVFSEARHVSTDAVSSGTRPRAEGG
jgi:anti-sigma B factor antagonist